MVEALRLGRIDLVIGSFRRVPERFAHELLYREDRVWVLSAEHPAATRELTLERLATLPHLIISTTEEDKHAVNGYVVDHGLEHLVSRGDAEHLQEALVARRLHREIPLTTPHFLAALAIVSRSDLAALLPRKLATAASEQYRLRVFEAPYPSASFDVMALWHRGYGEQPAVVWLRHLLRQIAAAI